MSAAAKQIRKERELSRNMVERARAERDAALARAEEAEKRVEEARKLLSETAEDLQEFNQFGCQSHCINERDYAGQLRAIHAFLSKEEKP